MQRKQLMMLALASALFFSTGVAAKPRIQTHTAPGTNFADYKSYTWIRTHPPGGFDPIRYQNLQAHIDASLATKGYNKGTPADLTMVLTVGKRQKVDLEVSLDAFDTKTKKALWHGTVTEIINPNKPDPARAEEAIGKLLEHFPAH
jgi:hypothetical protein